MSYFVKEGRNDIEYCEPHDEVKENCAPCVRAAKDSEIAALQSQLAEARKEAIRDVVYLLGIDGHRWSTRPCGTCQKITDGFGVKFGCNLFASIRAAALRSREQKAAPEAAKPCRHPGTGIDKTCPTCGEWTGSVVMQAAPEAGEAGKCKTCNDTGFALDPETNSGYDCPECSSQPAADTKREGR